MFEWQEDKDFELLKQNWKVNPYPVIVLFRSRIAYLNPAAEKQFFLLLDDAEGLEWRPLLNKLSLTRRQAELGLVVRAEIKTRRVVPFKASVHAVNAASGTFRVLHVLTASSESESAREERDERLNLALQSGIIGFWDWDPERNDLHWDDSMYGLYRLNSADFENARAAFDATLVAEDLPQLTEAVANTLAEGVDLRLDYRIIDGEGVLRYIRSTGKMLKDERGKPVRISGVNIDITEQKRSELAELSLFKNISREQQLILNGMVKASPSLLVLFDLHEMENVMIAGQSEKITGFTIEELESAPFEEIFDRYYPDDFDKAQKEIERAIEKGPGFSGEYTYRFRHKNGDYVWLLCAYYLLNWELHGESRFMAVNAIQDITPLKQMEAEKEAAIAQLTDRNARLTELKDQLRDTAEYNRKILESAREAIGLVCDGKFIDANETAVNLFGAKNLMELQQIDPVALSPETQPNGRNSLEMFQEYMELCRVQGYAEYEWVLQNLQGTEFYVDVTITILEHRGAPMMLFLVRDIDEQKKTQLLLEANNRELTAKHKQLQRTINELQIAQYELERVNATSLDRRQFIESLMNGIDDYVISVNKDLDVVYINDSFIQLFKRHGIVAKPGKNYSEIVNPAELQLIKESHRRAQTGEIVSREFPYKFSPDDDKIYYALGKYSPVINKDGEIAGSISVLKDISDRKQHEIELAKKNEELSRLYEEVRQEREQSEARKMYLSGVLDSVMDNLVVVDREYGITAFNTAVKAVLEAQGLDVRIGQNYEEVVNPELWEQHKQYWERAMRGEAYAHEFHYDLPNTNERLYFYGSLSPLKNTEGEVVGVVGLSRDITEQKRLQIALKEKNEELQTQEEELRSNLEALQEAQNELLKASALNRERLDEINSIINSTDDFIFAYDKNLRLIHFNEATRKLWQSIEVDLQLGVKVDEEIPPHIWSGMKDLILEAMRGKKTSVEIKVPLSADLVGDYILTFGPIRSATGEIIGVVGYAKDITERIQKETQINEINERLRKREVELEQTVDFLTQTQKELEAKQIELSRRERHYSSIFEGSRDAIMLAEDGVFVECNASCLEMFRCAKEEFIGQTPQDFSPAYQEWGESSAMAAGKMIREAISNGESKFDWTHQRADGEVFDAEIMLSRIVLDRKNVVQAIVRDVTDRKRQQAEIEQKNQELERRQKELSNAKLEVEAQRNLVKGIIDSSNDSIIAIDKNFKIIAFNSTTKSLMDAYGIPIETGKDISSVISANEWESLKRSWKRALAGEKVATESRYVYEQTGEERFYELNFSPVPGRRAGVQGGVLFAKDVTLQKRQKLEIEQKNQELLAQEEELRSNLDALQQAQQELLYANELNRERLDEINSIINSTEDFIFAYDTDLKLVHFNESVKRQWRQLGVELEIEKEISELIEPKVWNVIQKPFMQAMRGHASSIEIPLPEGAGVSKDFILTFNPILTFSGEITGVVGNAKDITERKTKERQVREINMRLKESIDKLEMSQAELKEARSEAEHQRSLIKDIIDSSKDVIMAVDHKLRIINMNFRAEELLKTYEKPFQIGSHLMDIIPEANWKEQKEWWQRTLNGEQFSVEANYYAEEAGQTLYFDLSFSPLKSIDAKRNGASVFARDVTLQKNQQMEIQQKNEELEAQQEELRANLDRVTELNESLTRARDELRETVEQLKETQSQLIHAEKMSSLGQLTAGIAHEINNPINYVNGGVDALEENISILLETLEAYETLTPRITETEFQRKIVEIEKLKEDTSYVLSKEMTTELLDSIKIGASRTAGIVKNLRNFSRLDEAELQEIDIREGIDSALLLLNNKIKNRVRINKDYAPEASLVECYAGQLNQVFLNLLSNAADAIEGVGDITIKTKKIDEARVEIVIADTGAGIPDDVLPRIFEPFYTTKKVGEGTGLGLSISHSIIKEHRGTLEAKNRTAGGAEFKIIIPARLSDYLT